MEEIPQACVPFISAMGLLMYFEEAEVIQLLTAIAQRFPRAEIFFDAIPPHFSKKTLNGYWITRSYQAPVMPWGISIDKLPDFIDGIPGLRPVRVLTYAQPYPSAMPVYSLLSKVGPIRRRLAPSLVHAAVDNHS